MQDQPNPGKGAEEIRRLADRFSRMSNDELMKDTEFQQLTQDDLSVLAAEQATAPMSEAEAFELFDSGDSTLTELKAADTLDALVGAVREMAQDKEGRSRLFDAVVTAVAKDAALLFGAEKRSPLVEIYRAHQDDAFRRFNEELRREMGDG